MRHESSARVAEAAGSTTPSRLCPACGAAEPIVTGERLWPSAWHCSQCRHGLDLSGGIPRLAPELDDTDEGFDPRSFELLERVEADHFWFVTRNELIAWLVRQYKPDARRVMEIGCGTGFVLGALRKALPQATIAGSELHSRGLDVAARRQGKAVELLQMDARRSQLRNAFDLVGAFDVLEHIPDDEATLREIAVMLAPGGRLIASVPQHPWMWSPADDLAHHQRRYRRGELMAKAEAAGLRPIYTSSFVFLAFPAMAAARFLARRKADTSLESVHQSEFEIGAAANRLLMRATRIEHGLRKLGLPMPFGGSQIVIAERPR